MIVGMTNKNGIVLKTAGKYCIEDVIVRPDLPISKQVINVVENGKVYIEPGADFYAIANVALTVNVPVHKLYPNAEGVGF